MTKPATLNQFRRREASNHPEKNWKSRNGHSPAA
jgi:hypothetical protein